MRLIYYDQESHADFWINSGDQKFTFLNIGIMLTTFVEHGIPKIVKNFKKCNDEPVEITF